MAAPAFRSSPKEPPRPGSPPKPSPVRSAAPAPSEAPPEPLSAPSASSEAPDVFSEDAYTLSGASTAPPPIMPSPANLKKADPLVAGIREGVVLAGKYRVERVIGSGGMGVVVAAMHLTLGQRVAIKVLRSDVDGHDEAVTRFMREARAAARIQSEHVARVFDVATLDDGTPYMVMEFLEGCDLRDLVLSGQIIPVQEALDYVLQACEALAEAHAVGIVHRDMKPSNLFLARRSNGTRVVKLLDFGISKVLAAVDAGLTTTNSLVGSPLYMSPEQMRSSRDVDARADIWALGAILYELLAGAPPFLGETIPEVCVAVMGSQPEPLRAIRADVPAGLEAVILRCLEKDREKRYADVALLATDLQPYFGPAAVSHVDRASAALHKSPASMEAIRQQSSPDSELATQRTLAARFLDESSSTPSGYAQAEARRERVRRALWIAVPIVAALSLGATFLALRSPPSHESGGPLPAAEAPTVASAASAAASAVAPAPVPSPLDTAPAIPPPPTAPFASALGRAVTTAPRRLPGAPRAEAAPAPSPVVAAAKPAPVPEAPPPPPKKPPAHPAATDGWQWGDRN